MPYKDGEKRREHDRAHVRDRKAYRHAHYMAHREQSKEAARMWRAANPERVRTIAKRHRDAHPGLASERSRSWRKANPEKAALHDRRCGVKRRYGITLAELDEMLIAQGNRCAACDGDEPGHQGWEVDHDHVTGKVRGILCGPCNRSLGYAKDSETRLAGMLAYLRRSKA